MKLLVTGGAGYIGSVVTSLLLDAGHDVTVLDDLSTGHAEAVPAGATFLQGRVHDEAATVSDAPASTACCTSPRSSRPARACSSPEKYWENNVVGTLRLLDAMRAAGRAAAGLLLHRQRLRRPGRGADPGDRRGPARRTRTRPASSPSTTRSPARPSAHGLAAVSLRYFNVAGALIRPDGP